MKENAVRQSINDDPTLSDYFRHLLDVLGYIDRRLYYRDQNAESLTSLARLCSEIKPTVIVELGTLSGLSLRAWIVTAPEARIHCVDLSFEKLNEIQQYFPFDHNQITYHEKNILDVDFKSLWNNADTVLFFVDAHDLPDVPIMQYVIDTALPNLPKDSVVVIDDVWRSEEILTEKNIAAFFDSCLLDEIDELQCFTAFYAPYHGGGAFAGFREVIPLLEFVNENDIRLEFENGEKHVWFQYGEQTHEQAKPSKTQSRDTAAASSVTGRFHYNPLVMKTDSKTSSKSLSSAAGLFEQYKFTEAQTLLNDLIKQEANPEAYLALAYILARTGKPEQALSMCQRANMGNSSWKSLRLMDDLEKMLGFHEQAQPTGKGGVTIFAIPKSFEGQTGVIQRNAIRSWRNLGKKVEIILFGDEPGLEEIAQEVGARRVLSVAHNELGTPLVNDIFNQAGKLARYDYLAYVNADIILFDDFLAAVEIVRNQFDQFLLIGNRWDFDVVEEFDQDTPLSKDELMRSVEQDGIKHAETGLDYFVHKRNLWKAIPPFALGRCAWDNWLVMQPNKTGENVVDGSDFISAIHQEHDYGHLAGRRNEAFLGVEAWRNRALAGPVDDFGLACSTRLKLTAEGSIQARLPLKPTYAQPEVLQKRVDWLQRQAQRFLEMGHPDVSTRKHEEVLYIDPKNAASKAFMESC